MPVVPGVVQSSELADLAHIYEPGVNLCIIQRKTNAEIKAFVSALLRQPLEIDITEKIAFELYDFNKLVPKLSELSGYATWCRDVARLTALFCDLLGVERVGLRLRTLDKPMCPRFHTDHILCRLVCTYGGLGTQWLPNHAVDRDKLGAGAQGLPDIVSGLIRDEHAIQTLPEYAVGLMKGDAWEGNELRGLVHRSPHSNADAPRRLLLTLDAV
jgi:hypothetical protein